MLGRFKIKLGHYRRIGYVKKIKGNWKLVVNAKYTRAVKFISRFVLLMSVVTAFIALPPPVSIFVSLGLIAVEQIIERTIFYFSSLLIVPFPPWKTWKKANFTAMIFGVGEDPADPMLVGMAFTDEEAAKEVWSYIEYWAQSEKDYENYLNISLIINKKAKSYAFFAYPSFNRPSDEKIRAELGKDDSLKDQEHIAMHAQMLIVKVFPLRTNSSLNTVFLPSYKEGDVYAFKPFVYENGNVRHIPNTTSIMKGHIKIRNVNEVTKKDIEYHSVKYDINWRQDDSDVKSSFYQEFRYK